MKLIDLFQIDGSPIVPNDSDMELSFEDLDSSDSGRDESGYMHRIVVRYMVGKWSFAYFHITNEEYTYMENLFDGKDTFQFTRPARKDCTETETSECYRSKYGIVWKSSRTGDYRNYKFNIVEC